MLILSYENMKIPAPLELSPLLISEERGSQKITVKLFLSDVNIDFIKGSLDAGIYETYSFVAEYFYSILWNSSG